MDRTWYADHFRADAARFATAARKDLESPVPSCPGWTVDVLLGHLTMVVRFQGAMLRLLPPDGPAPVDLNMASEGRVEAFEEAADATAAAMATTDPSVAVWTWSPNHTAGFWIRRVAQETAVHRWDAENAVGETSPIDPELAADGIAELLEEFVPSGRLPLLAPDGTVVQRESGATASGDGCSLHIHTTDIEVEWVVRMEPKGVAIERGHEKCDLAVRGAAQDVLLLLWGRTPPSPVDQLGDTTVLDLWREAISLD